MTEQFFHSNEIEDQTLESLESEPITPNFVSPNLSSKNILPIDDIDTLIDQEVPTNDKSDSDSNDVEEE